MLQNSDVTAPLNAPAQRPAAVVTGAATPSRFSVTTEQVYMIYIFVCGVSVGLVPFSVFLYLIYPHPYWLLTGAVGASAVGIWGVIVAIAGGHLTTINQRIQQRIDQWKQRNKPGNSATKK
jgi:hypothetical protein